MKTSGSSIIDHIGRLFEGYFTQSAGHTTASPSPDDIHSCLEDPLSLALAPPPNETPEERKIRQRAETNARRRSQLIDAQILQEELAMKKIEPVKLLLVGQSDSDKFALVKEFKLLCAPDRWTEELLAWRTVIYSILVRSVLEALDLLVQAMEMSAEKRLYPPAAVSRNANMDGEHSLPAANYVFTDKHNLLRLRLAPLRDILEDLEEHVKGSDPFSFRDQSAEDRGHGDGIRARRSCDDVIIVLVAFKEDMKNLCQDPVVTQILTQKNAGIMHSPESFLHDIERIMSPNYEPTNNDLVRASRIRKVGVEEHKIFVTEGDHKKEWIIYNTRSTRSLRALWASFFDDVDAVIFLSSVSSFDEVSQEDPTVNCLEYDMQLWRAVCSSSVFANTQIVLLLNKCDILAEKIGQGVLVKKYVPNFADLKNEPATVINYFRQHFQTISKDSSSSGRVHILSTADSRVAASIMLTIKDNILRRHLTNATII